MCHHACMAPCPQPYSQPRGVGPAPASVPPLCQGADGMPESFARYSVFASVGLWAWRKRVRAGSTSPNRSCTPMGSLGTCGLWMP